MQHDNVITHTSTVTSSFLRESQVTALFWPTRSPGLTKTEQSPFQVLTTSVETIFSQIQPLHGLSVHGGGRVSMGGNLP